MAQYLNTNISSLNSQRHLNNTQSALQTSLERLSSGKRINTAKDDAAGLGISERMTTQINGMNQAIRNANDGISMSQTAEGALASSGDMLQRIRTLAVQSSNATNNSIDRQSLQDEVNQLTAELNRIATTTKFNGQNLLDGTLGAQYYQVGANAGDLITTSGTNFQTSVYGNNRTYTTEVGVAANAKINADAATVNGKFGSATVNLTGTAKKAAAEVNAVSDKTGVTASAKTEALFTGKSSESYTLKLASNNTDAVSISFTIGSGQTNDDYSAAINAFNAASSKTGVSAAWDQANHGIKLVNSTGETITLSKVNGADGKLGVFSYDSQNGGTIDTGNIKTAAVTITDAGVSAVGTVTFDSDASFSLGNVNNMVSDVNSKLKSVASLDISTFEGAQLAIKIADSAIDTINAERAKYGALQSRFESTVKNLEINSENTSNARSRIKDADYASETAEMSRASILQQAGTAMLAQANQSKQTVLSLLG